MTGTHLKRLVMTDSLSVSSEHFGCGVFVRRVRKLNDGWRKILSILEGYMKTYRSVQDLLGELDSLDWDSALFVDQGAWTADPWHAEILLLEGDDELEDVVPGTHLPKIAKSRDMRQLFDTETFRGIVDFERRRNSTASVADIVFAVNYYREKDDFYDPQD